MQARMNNQVNDSVPVSLSQSQAKRVFINREPIGLVGGNLPKEPGSPSKRSQNYSVSQAMQQRITAMSGNTNTVPSVNSGSGANNR